MNLVLPLLLGLAMGPRQLVKVDVESLRQDTLCGDCHKEIFGEWSQSAHALAVADPEGARLRKRYLRKGTPLESYLSPTLLLEAPAGRAPRPRAVFTSQGVDCIACHADAGFVMHGPKGTVAPHKVAQDARYRGPEVCTPCHGQGDSLDQYTSWKGSAFGQTGITCQECHMPFVDRQLVQHWAMPDLPTRESRRHTFAGGDDTEFVRRALRLSLSAEVIGLTARVANTGAGHLLPGIGWRELVLEVNLLDARGRLLKRRRESIGEGRRHDRIAPGGVLVLQWSIPAATAQAETRLIYKKYHDWPDQRGRILLEERLELPRGRGKID